MRFQAPRGTEDILPGEVSRWLRLEEIFRRVTGQFGFSEIRTPMFEDTDLFLRTAGDTSDIVTKEMYTFLDKGDRSMTLKPEGTAPVMRAVIEHSLCPVGTTARLRYLVPCFRYGRPGKGRLRQLHQMGAELIGSASADADAEVIEMVYRCFAEFGLPDVKVLVNSIGREECRTRYRQVVLDHVKEYLATQDEAVQAAAQKNPLRLLDTKDAGMRAALAGLPPITDYLEEESKSRFERIQALLTEAEVPYEVRPETVRGLDYYTETVFEVIHPSLGDSSVCGGGRYDNLIQQIGGSATPSVGFGIGVERTLLALDKRDQAATESKADAFVVMASSDAANPTRALVRSLRKAGFEVLSDVDQRSFKSQMRQADKSGAPVALILGTDEISKGTVQLKDLAKGQQEEVLQSEVADRLRNRS